MLLNLYLFTSVQVKLSSLSFAYMNRQLMKQSLFTLYVHASSSGTALGDGRVALTPIASDPCVSLPSPFWFKSKFDARNNEIKKVRRWKDKQDWLKGLKNSNINIQNISTAKWSLCPFLFQGEELKLCTSQFWGCRSCLLSLGGVSLGFFPPTLRSASSS